MPLTWEILRFFSYVYKKTFLKILKFSNDVFNTIMLGNFWMSGKFLFIPQILKKNQKIRTFKVTLHFLVHFVLF